MTQDDVPDEPLSREELHDEAVRLLLGVLRSASTDDIAPKDWWRRAQVALEWGASTATSFHEMTAKMAESLEIEAPTKWTSQDLKSVYSMVREHDQFHEFRRICEQQAFAITSDAQVVREMEREEYEEQSEDDVEYADPFGLASSMDLPSESDIDEEPQ